LGKFFNIFGFGLFMLALGIIILITMMTSSEVQKANQTCYEGTMVITNEEQLEDITEMIKENYSGGFLDFWGQPYTIKTQGNGGYILDYQFLSRDSNLPLDKYIK
jgi:hypothetical protein